jgi:hypothetical protein
MRARHLPLVALALLTLAAAGCGVSDPYKNTTTVTATAPTAATSTTTTPQAMSPPDNRDPAPERGGTIPRRTRAVQDQLADSAASPTPQRALERYAAIYLNWDAASVVAIQRRLAAISLGQARAQAQQAATSASRDPKLTASKVTNRGRVIAISPGLLAAARHWVIVTREQTSGQGDYHDLPATLHVTYAAVAHTAEGWVVNQWAPQN